MSTREEGRWGENLKEWWSSDLMVMLRRVAIIYLILILCRVVFYIYNYSMIGTIEWAEAWNLVRGAFVFDGVSIVYAYGLFCVFSMIPIRIREHRIYQKVLFWYFIVIGAVVVALNLADAVYCHYTGIRLTGADVMFAENTNTGLLIGKFLLENWYLVLIWAGLVMLMGWLYRYTGRPKTPIKNIWAYSGVGILMLALCAVVSIAMVRGGDLSRTTRPVAPSNAMAYTQEYNKGNLILSNPFCIIRTLGVKRIITPKYFSAEQLSQIYIPYHYPEQLTGEDKGTKINEPESGLKQHKNVIIFILESFGAEHSGLLNPDLYPDKTGANGYTPFLDSLMRKGYYFTRAYATGRKSIDALPSVLGSIPSFKTAFVLTPQGVMGKGRQLTKILADEGYGTMFFCGSPRGSMGFDVYANVADIKQMYDGDTYKKARPDSNGDEGLWGIWDEPFLDYMGEVLSQSKEPFISTLFTVTSHHPFVVPKEYEKSLPAGTIKIHQPVAYTDQAIRKFFERYKNEEWFKSSVFVFTGDHVSSERFAAKSETSVGVRHIMAFLYTPDGSLQGRNESVFQQTDIMPSVLGYLGYNRPYFAFGRDVFSDGRNGQEPMAINYAYNYQMITDSLVLHFDYDIGKRVGVYSVGDIMMQDDINSATDSVQNQMEQLLKAYIQQYFTHLEAKQYLVPDTESIH